MSLFPVLGFFDIYGMRYSYVADHWVYLPALPILILIGIAFGSFLRRRDSLRGIAIAAILLACACLTWRHNHVFKNPETLWTDTIAGNPESFLAYDNLGLIILKRGDAEKAIHYLEEALHIKPDLAGAQNNYGSALFMLGRVDSAIAHVSESIRINPQYKDARLNLGVMLVSLGKNNAAIEQYLAVLRNAPAHVPAFFNLANARN